MLKETQLQWLKNTGVIFYMKEICSQISKEAVFFWVHFYLE